MSDEVVQHPQRKPSLTGLKDSRGQPRKRVIMGNGQQARDGRELEGQRRATPVAGDRYGCSLMVELPLIQTTCISLKIDSPQD